MPLISEPLTNVVSDTAALANLEPGPPIEFDWRGQHYHAKEVLKAWKGVGTDRTHGSGESYVHKHWFQVLTDGGATMTIYFERQPRGRADDHRRWWLYSLDG